MPQQPLYATSQSLIYHFTKHRKLFLTSILSGFLLFLYFVRNQMDFDESTKCTQHYVFNVSYLLLVLGTWRHHWDNLWTLCVCCRWVTSCVWVSGWMTIIRSYFCVEVWRLPVDFISIRWTTASDTDWFINSLQFRVLWFPAFLLLSEMFVLSEWHLPFPCDFIHFIFLQNEYLWIKSHEVIRVRLLILFNKKTVQVIFVKITVTTD